MTKPVLLTTHSARYHAEAKYDDQYTNAEYRAAIDAGFELSTLPTGIFGPEGEPTSSLKDRDVLLRHFAGEEAWLPTYVKAHGGRLIVDQSASAGIWYDTCTFTSTWFSGRAIGSLSLESFGYLDEPQEARDLNRELKQLFDDYAVEGKLFVKSTTKRNLSPGVRTLSEVVDEVFYWVALACHNRPTELIWSQPIDIRTINTDYKKDEYRCFVVGGDPVSCSLYTDDRSQRDYTEVKIFAASFARYFADYLPAAYCLDIARLTDGTLSVVELNDFQGSGLFADHDLVALFSAIKNLLGASHV